MRKVGITATGSYFPEKIVTNMDLEKVLDTSDEWIKTRTGIAQRHYIEKGKGSADLALPAVRALLEKRGMDPEDIQMVLFATVTPDTVFPASSARIQEMAGLSNAWGFDVSAACSSFLYALATANKFVQTGMVNNCLVIGSDVMTSIMNPEDRTTAVLFGDAAGCALVEPVESGGLIDEFYRVDGSGTAFLYMPAGGSRKPASMETVKNKEHFIHQHGSDVFKRAVTEMSAACQKVLERNNVSSSDIKLLVPHQANKRIIDFVGKKLRLSNEQVMINIDRRGNTTSATLPTCLDEACQNGTLVKGDLVLITAFGAGFSWGASLYRWSY
ncbi:MAG: 3-oxoacyl-ACP synthase [Acidobacteria bacterium]|nr:MAG: 3-oxoacyl-ACP synthase [Acidobacteriota bacterium]